MAVRSFLGRTSKLRAIVCVLALSPPAATASEEFTFHHENVLGTSMELRVRADGEEAAQRAEARAIETIDRLAATLSSYDSESEFSRWLATSETAIIVSPPLAHLLNEAESFRIQTEGAFDPRAAAFSRMWAACVTEGRTPTSSELAQARDLLKTPAYAVDPQGRAATRLSACPLTLDAIAKGHIVEAAATAAASLSGVEGLLLNVGGDLHARGSQRWEVAIARAQHDHESPASVASILLQNASLATSGDSRRSYAINGTRKSHIIDPRTGQPAGLVVQASVIAPSGTQADALATAFNLLPPERSLALADSLPGVACLLVTFEGRILESAGWPGEADDLPADTDPVQDKAGSWSDRNEFVVDFELNNPGNAGGRFRRPYVVIWLEDEQGLAVRTLLVWVSLGGSGPDRWLPDLARWYRGDAKQNSYDRKSQAYAIGRPTRPPGQYSVTWDGKTDSGQPAPAGKYTLFIEAAREHGTHQLIRQEVAVSEAPFKHEMKGNIEIREASVELRPQQGPKP